MRQAKLKWANVEMKNDRVFVTCSKCDLVDAEHIGHLHALLVKIMTPEVGTVELDLRQAEGADTKLAAALVLAARMARKCGIKLVIHTPGHIQKVIEVCRLEGILTA